MNVAVPFTAQQYPHPLHYGGGWVQEPPPSSDGCSHDQANDGSCVPTFNPHLLTAHVAQQDKAGCDDFLGGTGREEWIADSGATFHVTGNPSGLVECTPPPLGRSLVVSDMRSLKIQCFGSLPMVMHSQQGDVQVKLLNVAYVPAVEFNLFSLHAIMPKCSVSLDAEGVHMLDGDLSFMRRDAGSYVEATRVVETPIVAAVLAPGKMRRIDIYDLHVSLAHSHADTFEKRRGRWELRFWGSWFRVLGVPRRRGGGWRCRGRPGAAPPGLCSVFSWIFRGSNRRLPAVLNT